MSCEAPCLLAFCRVSRHSQPPPCSPPHSSEATTAGGVLRDRHRGTTTARQLGERSSAARARLALLPHEGSAVGMWESRVLGEISKSVWKPFCGFHRDAIAAVGVPWPNVIDPTLPGRHTPVGAADHRAWAPGNSRHSQNDPTSPTRCPEEPFLLDRFPDGVREKFGTLSRARCSAARCPGRARSSAGAPSRRDLPPFVPLRSTSDGKKCDATIEA